MAAFEMKDKGMDDWKRAMTLMEKEMPRQAKQMLRGVGARARKVVAKRARQLVRKDSGTYHRSIKRGKLWTESGQLMIRVFSTAPHQYLIEHGHRIVGKDGSEHGFQPGLHVFERAGHEIELGFDALIEAEFDKLMKRYAK
ncbi:HK97 gp10 family phage protein [Paenibacillus aurantiacus]|uniref:HK97 gp10 family phage protein n=1 Tax=Paenibacillus aurantiacus TaxID=1936118 RepID=A0ABV5KQX5_9BACL